MSSLVFATLAQDSLEDTLELIDLWKKYADRIIIVYGREFIDAESMKYVEAGAEVICYRWCNAHDWSRNQYLKKLKIGDWCFSLDSKERASEIFIKNLKEKLIPAFEKSKINAVFQRSKMIMFKNTGYLTWAGTPHEGLQGLQPPFVDITQIDGYDKSMLYSLRDDLENWYLKGAKYLFSYLRSNHCQLVYDPNVGRGSPEIIIKHEENRRKLQQLCTENHILLTMDGLDSIFINWKDMPVLIKESIVKEPVLVGYYRIKFLKEDPKIVRETEKNWNIYDHI